MSSADAEEAASLLARDHAGDPRLWPICQHMARGLTYPARGILLRTVMEHHPDRDDPWTSLPGSRRLPRAAG